MLKTFSELDIKQMVIEILHKKKEKEELLTNFWNSSLCQRMIQDIKERKFSLDNESFLYYQEKIRNELGWQHISEEDINNFFLTLSHKTIGVTADTIISTDDDILFDNFSMNKGGLKVDVMNGQGTLISIRQI